MLNYKQMYDLMCEAATRAEELASEAAGVLRYMQKVCEDNLPDTLEERIELQSNQDTARSNQIR